MYPNVYNNANLTTWAGAGALIPLRIRFWLILATGNSFPKNSLINTC